MAKCQSISLCTSQFVSITFCCSCFDATIDSEVKPLLNFIGLSLCLLLAPQGCPECAFFICPPFHWGLPMIVGLLFTY